MKRRDFIKAGAATATVAGAAGAGAVLGSACGGLFEGGSFEQGKLPLPDMGEYIRTVDDGLHAIARKKVFDGEGEVDGVSDYEKDLARRALSTLYLTGMFGDLPDEGQVHPAMQERLQRALPEMERTVYDMIDYLGAVSDEDAAALQRALRGRDNPAMEIAEWLDGEEWSIGVSQKRRLQTRTLLTHVVSRLKNQPPQLVFDEYIGKVERIEARTGTLEEVERELMARVGKQAFFERQQRLALYAAAWAEGGVTAEDFPIEDLPPVELPDEPEEPPEEDAGVPEEAEPAGEPAPAPAPQPPPAPVQPAQPTVSCGDLADQLKVQRAARLNKQISEEEFQNRVREIKARQAEMRCNGEPGPYERPADLPAGNCDAIKRRVRQDLNSARQAYRRRELSRAELNLRHKEITTRPEYLRCEKEKKQRAGFACLGIGGTLAIVSIILIAAIDVGEPAWWTGVIMATPAAVLLIVGLVMLAIASRRGRGE